MAYSTGTATNHTDLWTKLLAFLTTDSALVAAGQEWTTVWSHATLPELVLQGPGLSGTDQVLVGMSRRDDALTVGESVIDLCGCTGIIPTAARFSDHVNSLPRRPLVFLDQNPMEYWFVANGRRFVVVIKISTIYQAMYCGLFLPYSRPEAYPYPMFIGGTRGFAVGTNAVASGVVSWRESTTDAYRQFTGPWSVANSNATFAYDSPATMLGPDAQWREGTYSPTNDVANLQRFIVGPRAFPRYFGAATSIDIAGSAYNSGGSYRWGYEDLRARIVPGLNGEVPLMPITLMSAIDGPAPLPVTYGILDGCFSISGASQSAENLITVGGTNHLVVPNVQRTGLNEYWALALE